MRIKDINELDGIDEWIYPLRQFIDIATRYDIKGIFNTVRPGHEYSMIFEYYVNSGRNCFDHFKKEFEKQMIESTNPKYVLVRVKNEFLPMIQQYKQWFERNKKETEIFEPHNPYGYMLELMISTEAELEHFQTLSENIKQVVKKGFKKPKTFESLFRDKDNARKVKEIFEIRGYTINGKWQGLTNDKTELLSAYYVLIPLLKSGQKITPTARIFYSEFGLSDEFINDRTLRKRPKNIEISNEFEDIFSHLLNPSK